MNSSLKTIRGAKFRGEGLEGWAHWTDGSESNSVKPVRLPVANIHLATKSIQSCCECGFYEKMQVSGGLFDLKANQGKSNQIKPVEMSLPRFDGQSDKTVGDSNDEQIWQSIQ